MNHWGIALFVFIVLACWSSAKADQVEDFTYTSDGANITITGYTGPGGEAGIPATIGGLPVTTIGDYAFFDSSALTSVDIPDSVTTIGDWAFSQCFGLTSGYFTGDAPAASGSVFFHCDNATVYYLPDTAGWGATLGGRPAVLWDPVITTPTPPSGTDGVSFVITGSANIPIAVEATTDPLADTWTRLKTTTLAGGSLEFTDPDSGDYAFRLYRIAGP
jgi:hypothetical protein